MTGPIEGVDVSGWQPREIYWHNASHYGCRFAFVKTSEGSTVTSRAWTDHAQDVRDAGVLVGPYHFVRWRTTADTPEEQVGDLLRVSKGPRPGDLRPALDLETGGIGDRKLWPRDRRVEWLTRAVDLVAQAWGVTPVIYAGAQFAEQELGVHAEDALGRCPWWRPSYRSGGDGPAPEGRPKIHRRGPYRERHCDIWQWTGEGRVPWIGGKVDRNVVPGGPDVLRRLVLE